MTPLQMLHEDLGHVMVSEIEPIQRHYGIEHWEPSIVLRNPADPEGQWVLVSNDDRGELAKTILQEPGEVYE